MSATVRVTPVAVQSRVVRVVDPVWLPVVVVETALVSVFGPRGVRLAEDLSRANFIRVRIGEPELLGVELALAGWGIPVEVVA